MPIGQHANIPEEELRDLYYNKLLRDEDIGKIYGVNRNTVAGYRKKYGMQTLPRLARNPLTKEKLHEYSFNGLQDW